MTAPESTNDSICLLFVGRTI